MSVELEQIGDCTLYRGDALEILPTLAADSVHVVITSPPYDDLRTYAGATWTFEPLADSLTQTLTPGGVLVWVVGDATINGSETGTSMHQALYFMEQCGLNLHDTMIYHKANPGGARGSIYGYWQVFEFMFVLTKGRPQTFHPLRDRANAKAGATGRAGGRRNRDGTIEPPTVLTTVPYGRRGNIWSYPRGDGGLHPAVFPEALARDHIQSWSNVGDTVLDPFAGSFTTGVACIQLGRRFLGIEIEPRYFDLGCRRIEEAYRQLALFPQPAPPAVPRQLALEVTP